MNGKESQGLKIGKKTFINTAAILLGVMLLAMILTQVVPMGAFERSVVDGREVIITGSYHETDGGRLEWWRFFTAPFEVFLSPDVVTAVMIIISIMMIGGVFLILDKCGLLQYSMNLVIKRFGDKKYKLLAAVTLFGMALGSGMGMFEETVLLVPITVALAVSLKWDALVGIGMSVLAVGFGFAASLFNPFTVGVAQNLAGLPVFSGLWLRILVFIASFILLYYFLSAYAKKIEKNPEKSLVYGKSITSVTIKEEMVSKEQALKNRRGLIFFVSCLAAFVLYIVLGLFVSGLNDYSMPVIAFLITLGGIGAGLLSGHKRVFRDFGKGLVSFLPSGILLMLAMSVKQIIVSGNIMDSLLYYVYNAAAGSHALLSLMIIFLFILAFDFFIGGASAKAFLVIPLLAPLAELIGVTRQSIVLAFTFGDGFSNMVYPTNAVLLIALGVVGVPYTTWFRWTWKLNAALLVMCAGFLTLAHFVNYGPF
ncbi:MAG: hypothetical protein FWC09_02320 [Lachnospiraceae bacterium]|nr:hypothetical protein [Lachnospiraceae bacterium]